MFFHAIVRNTAKKKNVNSLFVFHRSQYIGHFGIRREMIMTEVARHRLIRMRGSLKCEQRRAEQQGARWLHETFLTAAFFQSLRQS